MAFSATDATCRPNARKKCAKLRHSNMHTLRNQKEVNRTNLRKSAMGMDKDIVTNGYIYCVYIIDSEFCFAAFQLRYTM